MGSRRDSSVRSIRKVLGLVVVNVLVFVVLLALLEGAASLLFIGNEILRTPGVPEDTHAEHDELLGWVNRPDVHLPDMYGPGVDVRINSQRFRSDRDFSRDVPEGKLRIICSGDSFTFGYGVANEEVWCQRLAVLDTGLETINMGLGGYGVDQAYLWYMRDGTRFDHDVQIFAFLTDDFRRMRSDRFMGYGKPFLALHDDSLVVTNAPVPRTSWLARRWALHRETVARLDIVRLSRRLLRLDDGTGGSGNERREDERLREVVARIFADLRLANEDRQSRLVLVYFPGAWDYMGNAHTDAWRAFVAEEATRQGILFLDLVEELRRIPPTEVDALYAPNAHFSVSGNEWAARVVQRRLAPLLDVVRDPSAMQELPHR
jgi:hypothetical protein